MSSLSDPLLGRSPASLEFGEQLERAAATEVTVLIEGEHGSGKTHAARYLHRNGPRADGPLVEVDLVTLSPALVEAELFGHEAGAFTGASHARAGRFRRAEGGTIVLEDVDRLPPSLQVKLLRVLQERVVEPVGGEESIPIDVRVVATTARSLEHEIAAGRFRRDLYWRLAVLRLAVPPLRARTVDLSDWVSELVRTSAERVGTSPRQLTREALARLAAHAWPGNLRELENALERVLVLGAGRAAESGGGPGTPAAIGASELEFLADAGRGVAEDVARQALAHGLTLENMERALMEAALAEQRGNHSAAARQIGLTRRAFEYRLSRRAERDPANEESEHP